MKIINHYADHIRNKYGERVQKITVLGGFSCPNRDGSKGFEGCTFCNNESFAAPQKIAHLSITEQIDHGIKTALRRYKCNKFIVYFQAYSNTYGELDRLRLLYEEALAHQQVVGLAIGTRSDCLDEQKLNYLQELAQKAYISLELGIESTNDLTLMRINRGHDYQNVCDAFEKSSNRGIELCGHVILGFPWENRFQMIESAKKISQLPIDSLKIHQLHVVRDTPMERDYRQGLLKVPSQLEYQELLITFLEHLRPSITIQRVYGEAPSHLQVSPTWECSGSTFIQQIERELEQRKSYQGKYHIDTNHDLKRIKS